MLVFITDRRLACDDLSARVEKILAAGAGYVMLREKDLKEDELTGLAEVLAKVCEKHGRWLIVNGSLKAALAAGAFGLQLPFSRIDEARAAGYERIRLGVSVHSLAEALAAKEAGADWLLAGHVYASCCKEGLPGRGTVFIKEIREATALPVWAVGGLRPNNIGPVFAAGARAVCVRSALMQSPDPEALTASYLAAISEITGNRPVEN